MIDFVDFIETPNEKHLGIAVVKYMGKVILKYKIVKNKDGNGWFPTEAAYKISDASGESYTPAFMLDSRSEHAEVERVLRTNVNSYFAKKQNRTTQPSYTQTQYSNARRDDNVPF